MKKQKLVTLATAAVIAGVTATTNNLDSAKAATTTTTEPQTQATNDATAQAKAKVTSAQADVADATAAQATAQTTADQTTAAKDSAQAQLTTATSNASTAAASQATAQQNKDEATSAGIAQAETAVETAQSTAATASQAASEAQQPVASAQAEVNTTSAAATTANSQVATQQQAVSAAQTQVNKDQAATDLATAQTAATNAQNTVDETNSQVDALKAKENTESAGITLSQSYIDAYNSQGTYNSQDENYNPDLLVQVENEIKNFPNTATIIEYQPTAADEEAKVTDAGQLTFDQSKELTTFAASIINGIRKQIGVAPIKVTDGAVKIIMLRAAQEVKEGNDAGKSNALYEQNFNKAWNDADLTSAGIKSNLVSDAEIANEVGKYNYEINGRDTLPMRLDSTTSWINNGIESSYTMASLKQKVYEAIANPNQYYEEPNSLLTGKDDELLDQYLGVVFDAYGNLHMYFIDNYKATDNSGNEYEIPTDSIFFNGETTPAPLSATGGLTTADQAKLKDLQATLTTQQATLKSAKAALATAQAAATKLGVTAAVDATILQADQAKLATAKAALATAQKTATTAQAALNSAKANLTKAQQKALIADQALPQANGVKQSYLTVIGLLLLSALGLGAYGKKRRV